MKHEQDSAVEPGTSESPTQWWKERITDKIHYLIIGTTILLFLAAWEFNVRTSFFFADVSFIFPSLLDIGGEFGWLFQSGEIVPHIIETAYAVGIAVLLAGIFGIIGGSLIGSNEFVAEALEPLIYYFSSIPKIVLYPLLLVFFGIGIESKIVMGTLSALFPITVNCIIGSLAVDDHLIRVSKSHQASLVQRLRYVYLPSMINQIINGLRLGIGVGIIGVVLAELFASRSGLGNLVQNYFNNLQMSRMYAVLVFIFAVSFLINLLILRLQDSLRRRGYGTTTSSGGLKF